MRSGRHRSGAASLPLRRDSLNDEPMFSFFPNSVGVSTVTRVLDRMSAPPRWVTPGPGGAGFAEIADALLHE
jgi:hydroxymethylpyrimidine pyrophosphatase-like HAD family hydrolase